MAGEYPTLERIREEWDRALASPIPSRTIEAGKYATIVEAITRRTELAEELSLFESMLADTMDQEDRRKGEAHLLRLKQQLAALEQKLADFEREPHVAPRTAVIAEWRPQTKDPVAASLAERLIHELQRYCESVSWKYRDVTIHELVPPAERCRDLAKTVAASLRCLWIEGPEVWYRLRWEAAQYALPDSSPLLTVSVYPLIDEDEFAPSRLAYRQVAHPVSHDRAAVCVFHEPSGIEVFAEEESARQMRSIGTAYLSSRLHQMRKAGPLPTRVLDSGVMSIRDERLAESVFPIQAEALATRIEALLAWKRREAGTLSNENNSR